MAAYAAAIGDTSTEAAPWYVVPANHKWYRDLVISAVVVETLRAMDLAYPEPDSGLDGINVV